MTNHTFCARLESCAACPHRSDAACRLDAAGRSIHEVASTEPWECPRPEATAGRLAVVASLFNPVGYTSLRFNWRRWRAEMQVLLDEGRISHCLTVEAVYPGQRPTVDPASGDIVVAAQPDQVLWQKERLINLACAALPAEVEYFAWIDPDLHFLSPTWPEDAIAVLRCCPAAQLFSWWIAEEPLHSGRVSTWPSTMSVHPRSECLSSRAKPGGAWCFRRSVVEAGGMYDASIHGGGDNCMLFAWLGGDSYKRHPTLAHPGPMLDHWRRWADRSAAVVRGRIGCVPGSVVHRYHGSRRDRRYVQRHDLAIQTRFDPDRDLVLGENGLWAFRDPHSPLARGTQEYFSQRNDDAGRAVP